MITNDKEKTVTLTFEEYEDIVKQILYMNSKLKEVEVFLDEVLKDISITNK